MQGSNDRMRRTAYLVVVGLTVAAVMGTATIIVAQTVDSDATSTPAFSVSDDTLATSTSSDSVATSTSTDVGTTTPDIATSTPSIPPTSLTCTMAYTSDLYDTADGHAAPGATVIGTQSWTDCNDGRGHTYEFKITPDEYAALSAPDAQMSIKSAADLSQAVLYNPTSANTGSAVTDATTTVTASTDIPTIDSAETNSDADTSTTTDGTATATTSLPTDTETTTSSATPVENPSPADSIATTTATTTAQ